MSDKNNPKPKISGQSVNLGRTTPPPSNSLIPTDTSSKKK